MDLTHAERVKTVVRWLTVSLGKTQLEIAQMCGYDNGTYFSQLLNGRKPIAASLDERLASLHPDINIEYLRGNSSSVFLSGASPAPAPARNDEQEKTSRPGSIVIPPELAQMFTDMAATIRSQQEMIRDMRAEKGRVTNVG